MNGKQLKNSILQWAIQGKLVQQDPNDEPASVLLEHIREEKAKLVKEKKIKKDKNESIIYRGDDNKYYERINAQTVEIELPFEYPNSWAVLRLKDICQLIDGEKRNGKGICLDAKYLRGKSSATIIEKGKYVYTDDNIILVDGENSGEVFTVPQDGYMGSTFKQLWLSSTMWKPYILAFILFYKEELRNSKRGAAIPHLNKELFYNLPIGIPPYQEQQRIAERINELSQLLK
ncbi:restriction endonuclease subunit S [Bacteroides fragilis]|uniref:restriction endonuclease subunit S n=1 Tax=Bacteroides fragilis TaxID=817 RepID=UPI000ABDE10C|nr:restriction endonuclease subunit S [Bacteroides fragilis]